MTLAGLRLSRVASDPKEFQTSQTSAQTQSSTKSTFISLDSLELIDLLRHSDSPFRVMASSSRGSQTRSSSRHGLFSFTMKVEVDAMSWHSHRMIASQDWGGFQLSSSMRKRHSAVYQLSPASNYFSNSSKQQEHFMAFHSALYENGLQCIEFDLQHLTAQWNPSTIISLQRFLGRTKKVVRSIAVTSSDQTADQGHSHSPQTGKSHEVTLSVNANLESICICLNKEYQSRRLLDAVVAGVAIQFDRYTDRSLSLKGEVGKLRAWDPDTSKATSDRNRHILNLTESIDESSDAPFFSFQYETFRTSKHSGNFPDWVKMRIGSGGIDDFLSIKMRPLEFNYLSERTAELADYLNNGLPGESIDSARFQQQIIAQLNTSCIFA